MNAERQLKQDLIGSETYLELELSCKPSARMSGMNAILLPMESDEYSADFDRSIFHSGIAYMIGSRDPSSGARTMNIVIEMQKRLITTMVSQPLPIKGVGNAHRDLTCAIGKRRRAC
jgi:hypothetical protein